MNDRGEGEFSVNDREGEFPVNDKRRGGMPCE